MNIVREVRALLERSGYRTLVRGERRTDVQFEDDTVFGFVKICTDVAGILRSWEQDQNSFIRENHGRMALVSRKAWNAYAVFLTEVDCPPDDRAAFLQIEENFQGARKIARAGVRSEADVERALAPLVPVQGGRLPSSGGARFSERIQEEPTIAEAVKRMLPREASASQIVDALLGES